MKKLTPKECGKLWDSLCAKLISARYRNGTKSVFNVGRIAYFLLTMEHGKQFLDGFHQYWIQDYNRPKKLTDEEKAELYLKFQVRRYIQSKTVSSLDGFRVLIRERCGIIRE